MDGTRTRIDALVSLTGFSLVGGPAYNDSKAAEEMLARLDVPYLGVTPVEFQTLESWGSSDRGLLPVEATMMVAIPELDGSTGPMVFGGRSDAGGNACDHDMHPCTERCDMLAARVARLVDPVSYTHLDVYKRQPLVATRGNRSGSADMPLLTSSPTMRGW